MLINKKMSYYLPPMKLRSLFSYDIVQGNNYLSEYRLYWNFLSMNPNAIHILQNNINKVNWNYLSKNINAIHIL